MIEQSKLQKLIIAIWIPIQKFINVTFIYLILLIKKYIKIAISQVKNNG